MASSTIKGALKTRVQARISPFTKSARCFFFSRIGFLGDAKPTKEDLDVLL